MAHPAGYHHLIIVLAKLDLRVAVLEEKIKTLFELFNKRGGQVMWQQLLPFAGKLIDKLIPDPEAKAKAQLELAQMAQQGELQKMANETELYKAEQDNVTNRWEADANTGSWLAQNIRPLTLAYILTAYLGLALLDGFGIKVAEAYVTLLGQWGMLVMSAYFGGRTLEKIMGMKK
jgi:hypothetical protein